MVAPEVVAEMLSVAPEVIATELELAMEPVPERASVPTEMVVDPVYRLLPLTVSVVPPGPVSATAPRPVMEPEKVELDVSLTVRVCVPRVTDPDPAKAWTVAPAVVFEMSSSPGEVTVTALEVATEPVPERESVPCVIVEGPVKVLVPVNVITLGPVI